MAVEAILQKLLLHYCNKTCSVTVYSIIGSTTVLLSARTYVWGDVLSNWKKETERGDIPLSRQRREAFSGGYQREREREKKKDG